MKHTISVEYCGHRPTLNKELRPGQAYVLRAHGDFVGAFDSLEAAESFTPAHTFACRAHAIGCAVENIRDAAAELERHADTSPWAARVAWARNADPVKMGDEYLTNGTATCFCKTHPLGMAWAIRWILLGGEALTSGRASA